MSAINGETVVTGNLAATPKCFPAREGMDAMSDMRLLTRRRRRDPATGEWVTLDEPALTIVRAYRNLADTIGRLTAAGRLTAGTPLIVTGSLGDRPELWFRDDGQAVSANLLIADRIGLDIIAMQRREDARTRRAEDPETRAATDAEDGADPR
ncbi:hypothetical protein [Bifidobacterium simiarum]|uniref:hypothetical protein n=1 Tax=Bifidobacterium simiarum TaxID=2045441 RepID=UPI001BDC1FDE|nr:hypothetical protein [Bifidobacterium simiarum]MBT1167246.1 hypothetical protein [Bifidobacterium simiarum]